MKSTNHLTELVCRKASTTGKKLSDGQGMYLLVHKNGSKYWRMDFRLNGKRKTLALGVWPEVSLTRARKLREEAREQIHRGIDPLKHKRDQQRKRVAGEERTFSVICQNGCSGNNHDGLKNMRLMSVGPWRTMSCPILAIYPSRILTARRCFRFSG